MAAVDAEMLILLGVLALLLIGALMFTARRRQRGRTLYVLDERGRLAESTQRRHVSPSALAEAAMVGDDRDATEITPPLDGHSEATADHEYENELKDAHWTLGRPLCPCCEYPAGYDGVFPCLLCDWEEPLSPNPDWGVARSERDAALAQSRLSFVTSGSVLTTDDRACWGGELTSREIELRRQLREALDYLRTGDRPDTSETWDVVDGLLAALREEARLKHRDEGA